MSSLLQEAAACLGSIARTEEPLAPYTTYRLGGPAALFVEARSEDDLLRCRKAVMQTRIPVLVVGKGSNLLIADTGFPGLVITLGSPYAQVEVHGMQVRAGAATPLPVLARKTASCGLVGLEWAVGVPGTVGGALRMNAGGHGSQTTERLVECSVFDLSEESEGTHSGASLGHGYRRSNLRPDQIALGAVFRLDAGDRQQAEDRVGEIVRWRREHQPGGRNAGSVFINPAGGSAGQLIDAAGLRGHRLGSAQVSDKHANFIQSDDGGSASDVLELIVEVRRRVLQGSGVLLEPEIRLVGFTAEEMEVLA